MASDLTAIPNCPRCGDPCYQCTLSYCALDETVMAVAEALRASHEGEEPEGNDPWTAADWAADAQLAVDMARAATSAELAASTITTSTPLAEYRAQVKAEALREAADRWPMAWPIRGHEWLRARADQISRGGGDRG